MTDCHLHSSPFNVITPGNVVEYTVAGTFVRSWDSTHFVVQAVRPFSGDLIILGARGVRLNPASTPVGRSSDLIGVATRFEQTTKTRLWDATDTRNHLRTYFGVGVPTYSYARSTRLPMAISAAGDCYAFASTDGLTPADVKIAADGTSGSGPAGAKGRVWANAITSDMATIDDAGNLSLLDSSGAVIWTKTITVKGVITQADPAPDGSIWIVDQFSAPAGYSGIDFVRHDSTSILKTMTNFYPTNVFSGAIIAALWDNGVVTSHGGTVGNFTQRHPPTGGAVTWGLSAAYGVLHPDASGNLFATSGSLSSALLKLNPSTGATSFGPFPRYKEGGFRTTSIFSDGTSVFVGNQRGQS